MPGVAAIFNRSTSYGESISLYYTTQNLNLGLELQSAKPDGPHEEISSGSGDHPGIIENPSHVSVAQYLGVNIVVGITQSVSTSTPLHDVSVVSPVYKPLGQTETTNISVAISSSGEAAWVYYLRGPDADSLKLEEYNLNTNTPLKELGITAILLGSSIAAYYNPEEQKRSIIYQDSDTKDLYEYVVDDENSEHLKNSTDARTGTAVAVTFVKGQVFVYYTDERYQVRKIVKTKGNWGESTGIEGTPPLDPSSLLTVTTSSDNVNHIFYLQQGSTGEFTHIRDQTNS